MLGSDIFFSSQRCTFLHLQNNSYIVGLQKEIIKKLQKDAMHIGWHTRNKNPFKKGCVWSRGIQIGLPVGWIENFVFASEVIT